MITPPYLRGLNEAIDSDGNVIIIVSKLCDLFKSQVQLISRQRIYFCGYNIFI